MAVRIRHGRFGRFLTSFDRRTLAQYILTREIASAAGFLLRARSESLLSCDGVVLPVCHVTGCDFAPARCKGRFCLPSTSSVRRLMVM